MKAFLLITFWSPNLISEANYIFYEYIFTTNLEIKPPTKPPSPELIILLYKLSYAYFSYCTDQTCYNDGLISVSYIRMTRLWAFRWKRPMSWRSVAPAVITADKHLVRLWDREEELDGALISGHQTGHRQRALAALSGWDCLRCSRSLNRRLFAMEL